MTFLERLKQAWSILMGSNRVKQDYKLEIVPLDNIIGNPYQPRSEIDEDKLEELAQSIKEYGVITPIQVMPIEGDQYQLVAGERRVRASRSIGLEEIPALIRNFSEEEMFEVSFLDNLHREPMSSVDKAIMYDRLQTEFKNLSVDELGELIGKSTEEITKREWILDLPSITKRALNRDIIDTETARTLNPLAEEQQRKIITHIANEDPSPAEIDQLIEEHTEEGAGGSDLEPTDDSADDESDDQQSIEEDLDIPTELQDR